MATRLAAFASRLARLDAPGSVDLKLCDTSGIASVVLRNPERRNSLTGPMMAQLEMAVGQLERWESGAGVVVSGEGGAAFCSGADYELARSIQTAEDGVLMSEFVTGTLQRLRELPLLSVAAIDGVAVGGGAELCTAADWRVMASDASVRFVHAKMGASPGWGGAARLVSLVGRPRALRLLAEGAPLRAREATEWGLCDVEAPAGTSAAEAARALLEQIIENAATREGLRAIKRAVRGASEIDERVRREETAVLGSVWGSGAMKERFSRKPGS